MLRSGYILPRFPKDHQKQYTYGLPHMEDTHMWPYKRIMNKSHTKQAHLRVKDLRIVSIRGEVATA